MKIGWFKEWKPRFINLFIIWNLISGFIAIKWNIILKYYISEDLDENWEC